MSLPNFSTAGVYKDDNTVYFPPHSPSDPTTLIYLITGNPGLIGYYTTYLQTLSELLINPEQRNQKSSHRSTTNPNFSILGTSLAGFETLSSGSPDSKGIFSLQSQIELSEDRLGTFLHRHAASLPDVSHPTKVILIGHSVGAYILLELLRRQQERARNGDEGGADEAEFVGGICLFPTVTWIAKSPAGRRLGWALQLPGFARALGVLAQVLTFVFPESIMLWLVEVITGLPPKASRTSMAMVRSPRGVRQAWWMAGDEMRIIAEDRWDDALWTCERTKLVFYFGERDHWVDDKLRDELIRLRKVEGREWPKMVLDQHKIPHDFCIYRSDATAKITAEWAERILE